MFFSYSSDIEIPVYSYQRMSKMHKIVQKIYLYNAFQLGIQKIDTSIKIKSEPDHILVCDGTMKKMTNTSGYVNRLVSCVADFLLLHKDFFHFLLSIEMFYHKKNLVNAILLRTRIKIIFILRRNLGLDICKLILMCIFLVILLRRNYIIV